MPFLRAVLVLTLSVFADAVERAGATVPRDWTVGDSVGVTYFDDLTIPGGWLPTPGSYFQTSPDGSYFFFITRTGDLARDCNRYELRLFRSADVRELLRRRGNRATASAEPVHTVAFCSGSNSPGIAQTRWLGGSSAIVFLGIKDKGPVQVYRLTVRSGLLEQLTTAPSDVQKFDVGEEGLLYELIEEHSVTKLDEYPVAEVTGEALVPFFRPNGTSLSSSGPEQLVWFAARGREVAKQVGTYPRRFGFTGPWVSPDGHWGLALVQDEHAPEAWSGYFGAKQDKLLSERDRIWLDLRKEPDFARFLLVDLLTGESRPVFDAPAGQAVQAGGIDALKLPPTALWKSHSSHAILVNTALPLSATAPDNSCSAWIVDFDAKTGRWQPLEPISACGAGHGRQVNGVGWRKNGAELLVSHVDSAGLALQGSVYRLRGDLWIRTSAPASLHVEEPSPFNGLRLRLTEDQNHPPVATAMAVSGSDRVVSLSSPTPGLIDVWRAPVREVTWTEPDGKLVRGGLILPRRASTEGPPPLVIQAYYYTPDLFRPDGVFPSAYAAQPLAAQGFAVLTMDEPGVDRKDLEGHPGERQAFVDRIDSAVDELAKSHTIDPLHVGLIGFSRAGYLTYYAITHPGRTRLAAAINDDGHPGSYYDYLTDAAISFDNSYAQIYAREFGGQTFWQDKATWLELETSSNVDRVVTPALFVTHSKWGATYYADALGAFRLNRKPFEWLMFWQGTHQLVRPREREASLSATIDWMRFWLQNKIDDSPEKAAKYARWNVMRQYQNSAPSSESSGEVKSN